MKEPAFNFVQVPEGEQMDWLQAQLANLPKHVRENPCLGLYGAGPQARCKSCQLFIRHGGHSKTYFKCALRGVTNGPGTDHKANWPACGKYVEWKEAA